MDTCTCTCTYNISNKHGCTCNVYGTMVQWYSTCTLCKLHFADNRVQYVCTCTCTCTNTVHYAQYSIV